MSFEEKYGWDITNPNEWMIKSNQIWNDNELTMEEKMDYQTRLVKMYMDEKRDNKFRKQARKGVSTLGKMSFAMIKQEIFSIKNTKLAFRTSKQKKRLKELEEMN